MSLIVLGTVVTILTSSGLHAESLHAAGHLVEARSAAVHEAHASALSHLPELQQAEIEQWRQRILTSRTIKVICDIDDVWHDLASRSTSGDFPLEMHREQHHIESYMSTDDVCLVLWLKSEYDRYKESGGTREAPPEFELYWSASEGRVWTISRDVHSPEGYRAVHSACDEPFGPLNPGFEATQGCTYAAVTQSWLAGGEEWDQRVITARSVGFMRGVEIAIVPPDLSPGVWYDVFRPSIVRNEGSAPGKISRRHDLMRLRNVDGRPQLAQWRTIIASGTTGSNPRLFQIVKNCDFSYEFDISRSSYEQIAQSIRARAEGQSLVAETRSGR